MFYVHPQDPILTVGSDTRIKEQMSGPDLHVFTLKFLGLKKTGFSPIKNISQNFFDFCLPLFYATFQCGP